MLGQITRTSHSRVFDRVVRVDRRLKTRDHVGGTYPEYQTIIQRYWVRLWPDHQQPEGREELGEVVTSPVFFNALADPTHNGKSIMKGDRFIDVKNNRCYDVQAAVHPRGKFSYSQMIQFRLQRVDDCPQLRVPEGYPEVVIPANGGNDGPTQSHFIMRHFGGDEIQGWQDYPYYDGIVYNLLYETDVNLDALTAAVAAGKRYFRYYNVQSYPFSATEFGGTTPPLTQWFNYVRSNLQFLATVSHRRMRVANLVSLFPGFASPLGQQHELIPWSVVTSGERAAFIATLISLANAPVGVPIPCSGVFYDQTWLTVHTFQIDTNAGAQSGHGNTEESSPGLFNLLFAGAETAFGDGGTWLTHTTAIMALANETLAAVGAGQYPIFNGEHRIDNGQKIPKPWYFENAWNSEIDGPDQPTRWANAKAEFATDPRNVLSILCSAAPNSTIGVPEALDHWEATGGWLAFTFQGDADISNPAFVNAELAYADAAARLAALGFPQ